MKLAEISVKRPVVAAMLMAALVVFGIVSYPRVGVDLFPAVDFPIVTVTIMYPGADPSAMESKVADPVEESVNTLSGIDTLRSVSLEGVTQVFIQFELDVDPDQAVQDVRDRVSSILGLLPEGIEQPVIDKFDIGAVPVMSVAVAGPLAPRELTKLADDVVKERIQRVPGVGSVSLIGGREREIQVRIDPAALAGRGLTVDDLRGALQSQSLELPAGRVAVYPRELPIKTKGEVRTLEEIENIVVAFDGGAAVRVRDVAEVLDGTEEARSWSSENGRASIALQVRKQSGSNSVEVARLIHVELDSLRPELAAKGVELSVPSDTAPYIEHSIQDVQFDLLFGGMLAVVIILVFLHDFRATIISGLALPISVVATFAFIDYMGFTFNNMTMLALSLSIGILIDDAIVVIENIYRHLSMGKTAMQAALDATEEIGFAVIATTFSLVAVFVPVAVMEGIVGRFFFEFGMTVSFAVLVSLLVSFTLTPMLSSRFLRDPHARTPGILGRTIERVLGAVDGTYKRALALVLRNRWKTLGASFAMLIGSCVLAAQVGGEFTPPEDRAELSMNVELPAGIGLEATHAYLEVLAKDVREHAPGVTDTFVSIGGTTGQVNLGQIHVKLTPAKSRPFSQQDAMQWMRDRYGNVPNAIVTVGQVNAVGGGGFRQQPIQYNIRGTDIVELTSAAEALIAELKKTPGFVDLDMSYRGGKPELSVSIDRERAAALGVPVSNIARTLRAYVAGDKVTDFKDGLDLYDVTMQLPDAERNAVTALAHLKVRSTTGALVDLANVVTVSESAGPSQIDRQGRQRQVTVFANLDGLALGDATPIVERAAAEVVPAHLTAEFDGTAKLMAESFAAMGSALLLALIIVYMILAAQFNSFVHPFTIMLAIPLSVIGAFGGLYLAGMTVNIFSLIGVIMLMGLVTKNAILLVDYTNQLRREGKNLGDALLEAGPTRLRPILMTSAATVFGMLPVALALSEGGETRAPMAIAVIGGLTTSTLLTLLVVPVTYSLMDGMVQSRLFGWMRRKIFGTLPTATALEAQPGDS